MFLSGLLCFSESFFPLCVRDIFRGIYVKLPSCSKCANVFFILYLFIPYHSIYCDIIIKVLHVSREIRSSSAAGTHRDSSAVPSHHSRAVVDHP